MALRSLNQHYVVDHQIQLTDADWEDSRKRTLAFMSGFKSRYVGDNDELRREAGFAPNQD